MSVKDLIQILENNPNFQDLQDNLKEVIYYLKRLTKPCYCCTTKKPTGCQGGCQCRQMSPDICENCGHLLNEHRKNHCTGKWNPGSCCPCKEFEIPRGPGDR